MANCINYAWYIGKMDIFQYAYLCNDIGNFELSKQQLNYHKVGELSQFLSKNKSCFNWLWSGS